MLLVSGVKVHTFLCSVRSAVRSHITSTLPSVSSSFRKLVLINQRSQMMGKKLAAPPMTSCVGSFTDRIPPCFFGRTTESLTRTRRRKKTPSSCERKCSLSHFRACCLRIARPRVATGEGRRDMHSIHPSGQLVPFLVFPTFDLD